jgi:hypothetical protein
MPLFLKAEDPQTAAGLTMFSDPLLGTWSKPTGVYVPPSVDIDKGVVNVLLWLHGWYVRRIEDLFTMDRSGVRRQVLASGKNVVLVAPYLGHGHGGAGATYNTADLRGHWGELYLNQVLSTLALARDPKTYDAPRERSNLTLAGLAQAADFSPRLRLGKLIIACHSGGGAGMRNLVGALGRYKGNLAECWGFDCLYGRNAKPDDARFWYDWVIGSSGRPLYISYGSSTVWQSVKLDLMGQGLVTHEGARRDPEGPEVLQLNVRLGIPTAKHLDDLMGLDDLLAATTPNPKRPPTPGNKFAEQAAANLRKNAGWPADLMEMHYQIARDGLLERLKAASYL